MASCGPSSGIQEFTCRLAAPNGEGKGGCPHLTVKHIPNLAGERIGSEWFLNEISTRLQLTPLADGGIVGVSRHVEYFDILPHAEKSLGPASQKDRASVSGPLREVV